MSAYGAQCVVFMADRVFLKFSRNGRHPAFVCSLANMS
ncbi:hypothetical protein X805_29800 [Sphaerotilus natans subsp. natans DSM 6575]|uniref:Uncharacterized protein n=1 Tax=Sphaerotilus natans subsp. natans DSM 6575 TaxID=1286631 RepID=A0A059KJA7_9BURK|nr:hypothetical protein X805_29800 [Sphaerotilus natans subsp. natans DSM 6575]